MPRRFLSSGILLLKFRNVLAYLPGLRAAALGLPRTPLRSEGLLPGELPEAAPKNEGT